MFNKLAMALLATAMMAAPSVYAEMKIVVLDPARAIAGSDEGKLLLANLESELKEDQDKFPDPRNPGTFYKNKMDMKNMKRYDKLCFMDAAEELGMFAKPSEVNED